MTDTPGYDPVLAADAAIPALPRAEYGGDGLRDAGLFTDDQSHKIPPIFDLSD
jgi:hypothetical protein